MTSVLGTSPATGSIATSSLASITVTFDGPIANDSLGFTDFDLDLVNPDGSLTPVFDPLNAPAETQPTPNGPVVSIDLSTTSLVPGHYEFFLDAATGLSDYDPDTQTDGDSIAPLDGNNVLLSDFTIAAPGIGLDAAVGPYVVGSNVTSVPGSLDLAANPSQVDLYKITVPAGPEQSLGIEVDAQPGATPLYSAVALFDQNGNPIATADEGLASDLGDAYLFQGVEPGTYYIGVSGQGNVPGADGGYNLQDATAGTVKPSQPGGSFSLNIVANPVGAATTVTGFRLDHADPLDSIPSGFTLQFSGPVQLGEARDGSNVSVTSQVEVVDAAGQSWGLATATYDGGPTEISYVLGQDLPEGTYSVVLPQQDGLIDFADRTVSAPGLPDGVLATFTVPNDATMPSDDLGWVPPVASQSRSASQTLEPGTAAEYRFSITTQGFYSFQNNASASTFSISIGRNGPGDPVAPPRTDPISGFTQVLLYPGNYRAFVINTGSTTSQVQTTIQFNSGSSDSLASSGLGQTTALNLRLASPGASINPQTPTDPGSSSPIAPASPVTTTTSNSAPSSPASSPSSPPSIASNSGSTTSGESLAASSTGHFQGPYAVNPDSSAVAVPHEGGLTGSPSSSSAPSSSTTTTGASSQPGLFLAIGGNLVGRPSPDADHVSALGLSGEGGVIALAAAGPGLGQAIAAGIGGNYQPDLAGKTAIPPKLVKPEILIDGAITKASAAQAELARAESDPSTLPVSIPGQDGGRSEASAVATTENPDGTAVESPENTPDMVLNLNNDGEWNGMAALVPMKPVQLGLAAAMAWGAYRVYLGTKHPQPVLASRFRTTNNRLAARSQPSFR